MTRHSLLAKLLPTCIGYFAASCCSKCSSVMSLYFDCYRYFVLLHLLLAVAATWPRYFEVTRLFPTITPLIFFPSTHSSRSPAALTTASHDGSKSSQLALTSHQVPYLSASQYHLVKVESHHSLAGIAPTIDIIAILLVTMASHHHHTDSSL